MNVSKNKIKTNGKVKIKDMGGVCSTEEKFVSTEQKDLLLVKTDKNRPTARKKKKKQLSNRQYTVKC